MPGRPLSRRTTVGVALVSPLALAACDIDPPISEPAPGSPSPASPPPPEDSELVATVVAELVRAESVLAAALASVPSLSDRIEPLAAAHAAHRAVLSGAVPTSDLPTPEPVSVPGRIIPALRTVRRSEQRLLRSVRAGCVDAASGDLARVLASMAGSISQHAAALSPEVTS